MLGHSMPGPAGPAGVPSAERNKHMAGMYAHLSPIKFPLAWSAGINGSATWAVGPDRSTSEALGCEQGRGRPAWGMSYSRTNTKLSQPDTSASLAFAIPQVRGTRRPAPPRQPGPALSSTSARRFAPGRLHMRVPN